MTAVHKEKIDEAFYNSVASEQFCSLINAHLDQLAFEYKDLVSHQTLAIKGFDSVIFPRNAGGGIAGGSAAWVRHKHTEGNIHEPGMVAALTAVAELYPNTKSVFDVGALYGYFSLIAKSIFPASNVHAFEVNPNSYAATLNNIESNKKSFGDTVMAHHCALSDVSESQTKMRINAFSIDTLAEDKGDDTARKYHEIDVWSLTDFCKEKSVFPNLMKIDVEGYQAKIIPGAMEVIEKNRPVVLLEFDGQESCNNFGKTNKQVIEPMINLGYKLVWGLHRAGGRFEVLEYDEMSAKHECNSLGILLP